MCRWQIWLWGVPAIALLAIVAVLGGGPTVRDDLARRAADAIAGVGEGWAEVRVAGRDVTVTGAPATPEAAVRAAEAVARIGGVRRVLVDVAPPGDRRAHGAGGAPASAGR